MYESPQNAEPLELPAKIDIDVQKKPKISEAIEPASSEITKEREMRYEELKNQVDRLNGNEDKFAENLKRNGLYEKVLHSRDGHILSARYGVDRGRVMQGIEPATHTMEMNPELIVNNQFKANRFHYAAGSGTRTINGADLPASFTAHGDSEQPNRLITLHGEGSDTHYRSYVRLERLERWQKSWHARYDIVDAGELRKEEERSGSVDVFDAKHNVQKPKSTLEADSKDAPPAAKGMAANFNARLADVKKMLSAHPEMQKTAYVALTNGIEYRAMNDGEIAIVISPEVAPVFRKYWMAMFKADAGEVMDGQINKYSDGAYVAICETDSMLKTLNHSLNQFTTGPDMNQSEGLEYMQTQDSVPPPPETDGEPDKMWKDMKAAYADLLDERDGEIILNDPNAENGFVRLIFSEEKGVFEHKDNAAVQITHEQLSTQLADIRKTFNSMAKKSNDAVIDLNFRETQLDDDKGDPKDMVSAYTEAIENTNALWKMYSVTGGMDGNPVARQRMQRAAHNVEAMEKRLLELK